MRLGVSRTPCSNLHARHQTRQLPKLLFLEIRLLFGFIGQLLSAPLDRFAIQDCTCQNVQVNHVTQRIHRPIWPFRVDRNVVDAGYVWVSEFPNPVSIVYFRIPRGGI